MDALQRLVTDRLNVLGLSYREAAQRSGEKFSHGTLHTLATGRHTGRVSEKTVERLALAPAYPPAASAP